MRSLSRNPDDRYQHASDFAEELLGFLFSRSLKVSSRDLRELLIELRTNEPKPSPEPQPEENERQNLILQLIEDEFVEFKSLDEDGDAPITGSQPLDSLMGAASPGYDPASPLPVADFDAGQSSPPQDTRDGTPPPAPSSSPMHLRQSGNHPRSRMASPAPRRESGGLLPWIIALVVLVVGMGGAYYYFFVVKNL